MMSQKNYVAFAIEFADHYADIAAQDYLDATTREFRSSTLDQAAYRLAKVCRRDNPRFDSVRFFTACGMRADLINDYANMVIVHV